ncbi:putative DNA-directed DNA polymerase [Rosa chinensis]|uniref:Putative DNA-directed DNA polymerase n=1 Tax=Rosa chinensis TaxID=74649 RepID=A0A2P6RET0_ROSCH|nr:putative DNA-directed DNA polymerase [Rosa chinensis]
MQDHVSDIHASVSFNTDFIPCVIQEIVTTGKLFKLDHFETVEKVKTISLFEEIWGVGPTTALKLFEKGHRTLDDLKNEDSLTHS